MYPDSLKAFGLNKKKTPRAHEYLKKFYMKTDHISQKGLNERCVGNFYLSCGTNKSIEVLNFWETLLLKC
jgi:hypothetical protein